ncbi:hypothetical protein ACH5RR_036675 [Cinchona calisaya]|uniref:Uncharacterized protein n=1 Tax=Cinchona calisaya TaxID=153742 RepID=A0ABD2Y680_9GENT
MAASSSFLMIKSTCSTPSFPILKQQVPFHSKSLNSSKKLMIIKASNNPNSTTVNSFISTLKTTTSVVIFTAVVFGKFHLLPARAIPPPPPTVSQENSVSEGIATGAFKSLFESLKKSTASKGPTERTLLKSRFRQKLHAEAIGNLKTLLQEKLKAGKNRECFEILQKLSSSQPENTEWKFLAARLLNEIGNTQEAIEVLLRIFMEGGGLSSVLTLFEVSLLVDFSALEGHKELLEEIIRKSLEGVKEVEQVKEVRFARLFSAQLQFLLNNVDEALRIYEELGRENPSDFRPYFCKGMIYTLLGREKDAREQFAKYRQLSPKKIEVEWYLRTPIRRTRLFLTPKGKKN